MIKKAAFLVMVCSLVIVSGMAVYPRPVMAAEKVVWQEVKSEHFIIKHQGVPSSFVKEVVSAAEAHYRQTMSTLGFTRYKGWTWAERVKISIYNSRQDYVASAHNTWSGGQVNPATKEIVTFPSENGFFDSILPHELGHIIFREAAGFNENIPLWLDEGVAMYQERAKGIGADGSVKELIKAGSYIPLAELDSMALGAKTDRAVVDAFYNESASLVGFLIKKYEVYRFERLCHELQKGRWGMVALKKSYMQFEGLGDLEKAWRKYLNETNK